MPNIKEIFLENKAWVEEKLQIDPRFFADQFSGQKPKYLWIGCSDSRVLPNEITGTSVGDMFIHRNIANLVNASDVNLMSVVYYALKYLEVKDVIVCGHYGCGGVAAALSEDSFGYLDTWLASIKSIISGNKSEIDSISEMKNKLDRVVELNTSAQLKKLQQSPTVQELLANKNDVRFHGWVYDLRSGYLKDVMS